MSKTALEQGFEKTGIKDDGGSSLMTQNAALSHRPKQASKVPHTESIAIAVWRTKMPLLANRLSLLAPARAVKC